MSEEKYYKDIFDEVRTLDNTPEGYIKFKEILIRHAEINPWLLLLVLCLCCTMGVFLGLAFK